MNKKELPDNEAEERRILLEAANAASRQANREAKALGLTLKIIRDHQIIEQYPDGTEKVVGEITPIPVPEKFRGLKKGAVLCKK